MKSLLILFVLLVALVVNAQPTNAPATGAGPSFQAQAPARATEVQVALPTEVKPNEIVAGKVVYSGSAVQAIKTRKPLQLFNPAAPPQYGSPEDNVARDPINGKFAGWKVFAIRF